MKTIFLFRLLATALLLIQRVEATYSQLPQATNNKVYTVVVVVVVVVISWPFSLGLSSLLIIAQWGVLATRWRIAKKDKESFFKKPVFSFVVAAENAAKRRIECSCISYSFEKENRDIGAENTENPFFFFFPFDY